MKKFGVMKSVNICAVVLLLVGVFLFVLLMISIFASELLSRLMKYGFDGLSGDNKNLLFACVLEIVLIPVSLQQAKVMSGRFICVSNEKVYGNIGLGFTGKNVEFSYKEIISSYYKKDGVVIETAKGTFCFPKIQSAAECSNLINEKINSIAEKDI